MKKKCKVINMVDNFFICYAKIKKKEGKNMAKKSKNGLVIFLVLLLIILVSLVTLLFTGVIKSPMIKDTDSKEIVKDDTSSDKKQDDDNKVDIIRINMDNLSKSEVNELGSINVGGKTYSATAKYDEEVNGSELWNIYLGDTKLEVNSADYIAVMDNSYIVVKDSNVPNSGIGYKMVIYDKELKIVDTKFGFNSFRVIDNDGYAVENVDIAVTNKLSDNIFDSNNIIIYDCTDPLDSSNHNQDFVQKLLTFKDGKYSEREILHIENVFCSSQR